MCLITRQKEPKTLKSDIDLIVYKSLMLVDDNSARATFFNFKYKLGQMYTTLLEFRRYEIFNGRLDHAFADDVAADHYNVNSGKDLVAVTRGFHSYKTRERALLFTEEWLYECLVPKGSKYFEDETGLLVSDTIIIERKLDKSQTKIQGELYTEKIPRVGS